VSAGVHFDGEKKGTELMIVLGADLHTSSRTIAGIAATTGEMLADRPSGPRPRGCALIQTDRTCRVAISRRL
jgi:hypothetical protein